MYRDAYSHFARAPAAGAPLVFAGRAPTPVNEDERKRRIDQIVAGLKQAGRKAADLLQ